MNPIGGILLIALGSIGAASFYVPFKKVKTWAWESYWISQGVFAWLIIPWIFALVFIPKGELLLILREAPSGAKLMAVFFGILWGFGGLTFGLSLRYLGVALGQSIALGLCAAFGTLLPPVIAGNNLFSTTAGILTVAGVAITVAGIIIIGYAGSLKSQEMSEEEKKAAIKEFALKKGILIAVFAGIMSACFNFGYEAGKPIEQIALDHGTNPLFQKNPSLIFILLGGFITNLVYCVFLNIRNKTYKDYVTVSGTVLLNNLFFTFLAGMLWFLQFHFFGMGSSKLPPGMAVFGWSILMALNIAISNIWGIILKEWKGARTKTIVVLIIGIIVLILSTFIVKLG
ncbi:MAG TPA: L-rhamnose/proton symporter RhaT [Bacteroidales bacterium]|jgi:L-rhamnose-H+ transport protein|nr:L-rhamnose/proton symporter RhaT [Bacteroidales bacterium]OQB65654.1 MAG: L-rhamnose-proton symporter [Bacteroidetes bacterium ADurb.Bin145]HOU02642.1 L-rhamnose/proton symporter RhaT [Bacteroidales bacterium]HQG63089.1 L-rhamnose/proton symporter RhaT [Bacteroidales bacterium]HQK67482.1 L-rhamnose/proton symporter RhaT [Bacteroidales bacterium]